MSGFVQTPRFNYLSNDEGEFVFTLKKEDDNEITPTMRVVEDMASIDKFGTLIINSMPSPARVSLDNKYLGNTPFIQTVPQGQYLFKVEKENYDPEITIISVRDEIETKIDIPLFYSQLYKDRKLLQYKIRIKRQNFIKYGALFISVGSALNAYKYYTDAQSNYDKYLSTSDITLMDQYYDDYLIALRTANISTTISIPMTFTAVWTFLKPLSPPDFSE